MQDPAWKSFTEPSTIPDVDMEEATIVPLLKSEHQQLPDLSQICRDLEAIEPNETALVALAYNWPCLPGLGPEYLRDAVSSHMKLPSL